MRSLSFFILLLLGSSCLADVSAVINGPTEARVGDLIVLSGRESVGDNHKWVEPQKIQTLLCGDGKDLAFATGTPGTYTFMLIVADKEASIDYVVHTVIVRGTLPPTPDPQPDPIPDEPDKPSPPPPALAQLVAISRDAARRVADPPTSAALAASISATVDSLERRCAAGQCPGLNETKATMVQAIESTLLSRGRSSRSYDWANLWRVPINDALKELNAQDVPTYLAAMRAVSLGLTQ